MNLPPYERDVSQHHWTYSGVETLGKPTNDYLKSVQDQILTARSRIQTTKTEEQSWYLNPENLQSYRYTFLNATNPVDLQEKYSDNKESNNKEIAFFILTGGLFLSLFLLNK